MRKGRIRLIKLTIILVTIGIAELLFRLGGALLDKPVYPTTNHEKYQAEVAEYEAIDYRYQPYSIWLPKPFKGQYVTINEDGFRRTLNYSNSGKPTLRIGFFGGSTMVGMGANDSVIIPSLVSKILADSLSEFDVECYNYGATAYLSSQEMILLWWEVLLKERPLDIAVFYDGANEIWSSHRRRVPGEHNSYGRVAYEIGLKGNSSLLTRYKIVFKQTINSLAEQKRVYLLKYLAQFVLTLNQKLSVGGSINPVNEGVDPDVYAKNVAKVYLKNQELIRQMCRQANIQPLFLLQPVAAVTEPYPDFLTSSHEAELNKMYKTTYGDILAKDNLEDFVDLSSVLDGYGHVYFDWCHITGEGNTTVAKAIAQELLPRIQPTVVDSSALSVE